MPRESILRDRAAVADAVSRSRSIAGALQLLGLRPAGGNYRALHAACERFGLEVPSGSARPRKANPARTRVDWPSDKKLRRMVAASSIAAAGRELGVSGTAVRKHLRRAEQSRRPGSNGLPSPYKGVALPGELRRHDGRDWFVPMTAALVIAGLAAGRALGLAARDGSRPELIVAVAACAVILLAALAGSPGVRGGT